MPKRLELFLNIFKKSYVNDKNFNATNKVRSFSINIKPEKNYFPKEILILTHKNNFVSLENTDKNNSDKLTYNEAYVKFIKVSSNKNIKKINSQMISYGNSFFDKRSKFRSRSHIQVYAFSNSKLNLLERNQKNPMNNILKIKVIK